jgi:predicted RecA/RadA family phage recombinase
MKNFVQEGNTITVAAPADVMSGQLVVVGSIVGVAAFSASSGAAVEVTVEAFRTPQGHHRRDRADRQAVLRLRPGEAYEDGGHRQQAHGGRGHGRRRQRRHHRELSPDAHRSDWARIAGGAVSQGRLPREWAAAIFVFGST